MNIDRVAKAMTGGRPRAGFTARVMAPIHGRPSPGFTARVMKGIDTPAPHRTRARALVFVPAALALATGAVVLLRASAISPALPGAPALATNAARVRMPDAPRVPQVEAPSRVARASVSPTVPLPGPSPIYQIAALEGPAQITAKDIQPAACTIPALEGPAPLKVAELPSNAGGSDKQFKEQP